MSERHVVKQLLGYLSGNLDQASARIVQEHLSICAGCRRKYEGLQTTWAVLGQSPRVQPDASLAMRFRETLNAYELGMGTTGRSRVPMRSENFLERILNGRPRAQLGFVVSLLLFGLMGGYAVTGSGRDSREMARLQEEVRGMRNLLAVSLLQQESASERLKGVSWSAQADGGDPDISAALVNTMNHDRNVNVRLAALNALSRDMENPPVQREIIRSFPGQSSPLMQLALVNLLVQINTPESREVLERALQKPHLQPDVQKRIKQSIQLFL
jgi:hypothetical protein